MRGSTSAHTAAALDAASCLAAVIRALGEDGRAAAAVWTGAEATLADEVRAFFAKLRRRHRRPPCAPPSMAGC